MVLSGCGSKSFVSLSLTYENRLYTIYILTRQRALPLFSDNAAALVEFALSGRILFSDRESMAPIEGLRDKSPPAGSTAVAVLGLGRGPRPPHFLSSPLVYSPTTYYCPLPPLGAQGPGLSFLVTARWWCRFER